MSGIVERLYASDWGLGLGSEAASVITKLRIELIGARAFIAKDRDAFVRCHTIGPEHDMATMDPAGEDLLKEYDTLLANIDAALAEGTGP